MSKTKEKIKMPTSERISDIGIGTIIALISIFLATGIMVAVAQGEFGGELLMPTIGSLVLFLIGAWALRVIYRGVKGYRYRAGKVLGSTARKYSKTTDFIEKKLGQLIVFALSLIGPLLMLSGLGVFVYQIIMYLKTGSWGPMPLEVLITYDGTVPSYINPEDWVGLNNIVKWVFQNLSISIAGMLAGFWIWMIADEA